MAPIPAKYLTPDNETLNVHILGYADALGMFYLCREKVTGKILTIAKHDSNRLQILGPANPTSNSKEGGEGNTRETQLDGSPSCGPTEKSNSVSTSNSPTHNLGNPS